MSEIEAKCKELERHLLKLDDTNQLWTDKQWMEEKLEGFNLGIEMARKEFLEKGTFKCEDIVRKGMFLFPNLTREEFFKLEFILKQSLEEKK